MISSAKQVLIFDFIDSVKLNMCVKRLILDTYRDVSFRNAIICYDLVFSCIDLHAKLCSFNI